MPPSEARPEIVALLCDANLQHFRETGSWSHRDGRPFTQEERALVFQATRADLEELKTQHSHYMKYLHKRKEAPEAIQRFLAPFMEQLDEKNLGNAHALMTGDERAECDRLLKLMIEPALPFTPYTF
ncbi:hypothetical protein ACPB9J_29815 [Streptomyces lavendulocolor]|uniref:hypothetical protein n=1 Tax=Streptomyces lavendulocolor TaxID=67316 RepID=UPI003C2B191B